MYPTCKISKKNVYLQSWCCWWTSFGNSYIDPLLSVMTLQYHRLYQISSFEANLSVEDLKQLCRHKTPSQVYLPTPKLVIKPDLF